MCSFVAVKGFVFDIARSVRKVISCNRLLGSTGKSTSIGSRTQNLVGSRSCGFRSRGCRWSRCRHTGRSKGSRKRGWGCSHCSRMGSLGRLCTRSRRCSRRGRPSLARRTGRRRGSSWWCWSPASRTGCSTPTCSRTRTPAGSTAAPPATAARPGPLRRTGRTAPLGTGPRGSSRSSSRCCTCSRSRPGSRSPRRSPRRRTAPTQRWCSCHRYQGVQRQKTRG
mmetsp:Transcript_23710/g.48505  ORF Transcript_23710/g.48505 Transcript_23710/m.48505 type:complete len:223 (-) Transcript_23710:55-723(-)